MGVPGQSIFNSSVRGRRPLDGSICHRRQHPQFDPCAVGIQVCFEGEGARGCELCSPFSCMPAVACTRSAPVIARTLSRTVALHFFAAQAAMQEPHPAHGRQQGHSLYGIASLSLVAGQLQTIVEDCKRAGQSADAHDKFFLSYVEELNLRPSKELHSERPALESARASLAAAAAELSDALPLFSSCDLGAALPSNLAASRQLEIKRHAPVGSVRRHTGRMRPQSLAALGLGSLFARPSAQGAVAEAAAAVDEQNGLDFASMGSLMEAARVAILQSRAALK